MTEQLTIPGISVVIPAYFSAATLPELISRLLKVLATMNQDHEVILVNDGSTDETWNVIKRISGENYGRVVGINLMRNFGQHNATLCGIRAARFDTCVTMDDDLQHNPEAVPLLVAKLNEGFDLVYGFPKEERHGALRDAASVFTKIALYTVMNAKTARYVSAFRAFRTRTREAFSGFTGPQVSIDAMLNWGAGKITHIELDHNKRAEGKSHYTLRKLFNHAMNLMTGYSTLPLRITTLIGFGFTLFGILVFLYVIINFIVTKGSVAGFSFTASIVAIFAGAQLFALGIMGEYLARMYQRLLDKPSYIIEEQVGTDFDE